MMDVYGAIVNGAELHIIPEEIRLDFIGLNNYFEENGITNAFMTTQVGRQFALEMDCKSLKTLSIGGESLFHVNRRRILNCSMLMDLRRIQSLQQYLRLINIIIMFR